jgi:endonuclease/exonuclease/phosphatase family metal-dependent hydrolase
MKIINSNIERNKHLHTVIPFLNDEAPDVVCLQEVIESSVQHVASETAMYATFVPFCVLEGWEEGIDGEQFGIAFLSKTPHTIRGIYYYQGGPNLHVLRKSDSISLMRAHLSRAVLVADVSVDGEVFTVGTTHFTYTPDGNSDVFQSEKVEKLLHALRGYADLVLCGDFNIPRGNSLYTRIQSEFTDNIPQKYASSIDPKLHRKEGLELMVDYMWTKGKFKAENVFLRNGVSDHKAVIANIFV